MPGQEHVNVCQLDSRMSGMTRRLVRNICTMACGDPADTPSAAAPDPPDEACAPDVGRDGTNGAHMQAADPALAAAAVARQVSSHHMHEHASRIDIELHSVNTVHQHVASTL
jgi:hypothetical protein